MIKVGSDFSGIGAFNQALIRLKIPYEEVFACDMDKYARQTFIENYGQPKYFPMNVYEREIPEEPLTIYMSSPPCQAFSLAGSRKGKNDPRGILFFNSLEFIEKNKPRYFIFENVKGLLSDDNGKTFNEWLNYLGGKSINGNSVMFPYQDSVPYHVYWKVLNAKKFGVPQNRERVFIVGIRDDADNQFAFPKELPLEKRLKDILEPETLEKYYLSEKMIKGFLAHNKRHIEEKNQDGFNWKPKDEMDTANCLRANGALNATDNSIKVKSETTKGYELATIGDTINYPHPNSLNRRGRVGKQIAQTIDNRATQGVLLQQEKIIYNDGRLNQTLDKNILPKDEVKAIDTYNQKVQDNAPTITDPKHNHFKVWDGFRIRRLIPRECFRLMDFPDSFTWTVSDTQAYKQAGNSIVVACLYLIIQKLNLK